MSATRNKGRRPQPSAPTQTAAVPRLFASLSPGWPDLDTAFAVVEQCADGFYLHALERWSKETLPAAVVSVLTKQFGKATACPLLIDVTHAPEAAEPFRHLAAPIVTVSAEASRAADWNFTTAQVYRAMQGIITGHLFKQAPNLPARRRFMLELQCSNPEGMSESAFPAWRRLPMDDCTFLAVAVACAYAESHTTTEY